VRALLKHRKYAVRKNDGAGLHQIQRRAKGCGVIEIFRRAIDPTAFGAIKRQAVAVGVVQILAQKRPQIFDAVTHASDQREIAANRVLTLQAIHDIHTHSGKQREYYRADYQNSHRIDDPQGHLEHKIPRLDCAGRQSLSLYFSP
jgi:hypothetical protein